MGERSTHGDPTVIDVAVFEDGSHVTTQRCRNVGEARSFMTRVGATPGFDCLIVSPRLRDTLTLA